ncbi:hypothetical protein RKD23_001061 [Streptomyces sp. SAI-170]|uniref:hypothetical protein n=1 Tax=Streptomyces sp. SAI-170 TaxID=3377729 RepID=UPI003C7BB30A
MRVTRLAAVAALAGAAILSSGTAAAADPGPIPNVPVVGTVTDLVGTASPPVAAVVLKCIAPWKQWGFGVKDFYAPCVTSPVGDR